MYKIYPYMFFVGTARGWVPKIKIIPIKVVSHAMVVVLQL
jgi:hypothetical protein